MSENELSHMESRTPVENILNEAAKDLGYTDFEEMTCIEDGPYNPEDIEELSKRLILGKYGWNLSREIMPEFDGNYLVAGWIMQPCGSETKFQIVAECQMNQWVKPDTSYQFTFWRHLLIFPDLKSDEGVIKQAFDNPGKRKKDDEELKDGKI